MKHCLKFAGLGAALATATTASLQAEVKINDNLSLDGYVIGSGVVTEGTPDKNGPFFGKSGGAYDAAYVALNGTYKNLSARLSLYSFNPFDGAQTDAAGDSVDNVGALDAYVTYKVGDLSLTAGKYLGWLGFESFHSPNNAFISFSLADYRSPFSTGAKVDYSGEGFSAGVSVRDSQIVGGDGFFEGDGEFSDDIGYEAYVMFTGVEGLTLFAGVGYEDVDGGDQIFTYDIWASYALTEKLSIAGEFAATEDSSNASWLLQTTYALNDALSVSGRVTGKDGDAGSPDGIGYGVAATYMLTSNFFLKGEITKTDFDSGASDSFSYAIQGGFKF
jgi:hypothetical protein